MVLPRAFGWSSHLERRGHMSLFSGYVNGDLQLNTFINARIKPMVSAQ